MKFLKLLDELKVQYANDMKIRENGTILLMPRTVPRARHMLFKPLTEELINEYLISQYVHKFPAEYAEFLKYTNGANLFTVKLWHTIKKKRIPTAGGLFTIFGLPRTQPYGRPDEMEEPFDVRIEDLSRHKDLPNTWMKCGTYTRNYDMHTENDIFIDTETSRVYACIRREDIIVDSWESLDECFCTIFSSFSDMKDEYEFVKK